MDPRDLGVYTDVKGRVYFGARSGEAVVWLEDQFPAGTFREDADGRPLYHVPGLSMAAPAIFATWPVRDAE